MKKKRDIAIRNEKKRQPKVYLTVQLLYNINNWYLCFFLYFTLD